MCRRTRYDYRIVPTQYSDGKFQLNTRLIVLSVTFNSNCYSKIDGTREEEKRTFDARTNAHRRRNEIRNRPHRLVLGPYT